MPNLTSNLELNKSLASIGDKVCYSDTCNSMDYVVTDVFEGGLELEALTNDCAVRKGEKEDKYFNSLQKGWELCKTITEIWA